MKKNGIKKIKVKIKKDLKNFMKDENGIMSKENILKIGIGTIAALSMFSGVAKAQVVHTNDRTVQWDGPDSGEKRLFPGHTHHSAHTSY